MDAFLSEYLAYEGNKIHTGYVIFDGANGFFIGYKQDYAGGYGVVMILNTVGKYLCTLINGSWTTNTINIS